jgi:hypothetical protein
LEALLSAILLQVVGAAPYLTELSKKDAREAPGQAVPYLFLSPFRLS